MPAALNQTKVEIMLLSVFGDESADETKQRVWAVCGLIGNDDEWKAAIEVWASITDGQEFHAAECEREGNHDLYKKLTQCLVNGPLAGISYALNLVAYRDAFGESFPVRGYYKCLKDVVNQTAILARKFNDNVPNLEYPDDEPVTLEFTFDHRIESEGNVGSLYQAFINQPEWENEGIFGTKISFDCRTNPRIQMADLFAREAMKDLDRQITGIPPSPRKSYLALKDSGKFLFEVRDREYCEEWARRSQIEAERTIEGYINWLIETGRIQNGRVHDNLTNRCTYFALLDSRRKGPNSRSA